MTKKIEFDSESNIDQQEDCVEVKQQNEHIEDDIDDNEFLEDGPNGELKSLKIKLF